MRLLINWYSEKNYVWILYNNYISVFHHRVLGDRFVSQVKFLHHIRYLLDLTGVTDIQIIWKKFVKIFIHEICSFEIWMRKIHVINILSGSTINIRIPFFRYKDSFIANPVRNGTSANFPAFINSHGSAGRKISWPTSGSTHGTNAYQAEFRFSWNKSEQIINKTLTLKAIAKHYEPLYKLCRRLIEPQWYLWTISSQVPSWVQSNQLSRSPVSFPTWKQPLLDDK